MGRRVETRKRRPPPLAAVFYALGLQNDTLKSLVLLWIVTTIIATALSLARVIKAPIGIVVGYILLTFLSTLLTLYTANCLARGNCQIYAILIVVAGFAVSCTLLAVLSTR
jgi:hypothetical protein